jgi:CheY-like chemotaxis protein
MPDTTIVADAPTLPAPVFSALERSHIGVVIEDDVATRLLLMRAMREVPLAPIGFSSAEAGLVWLDMNPVPDLISVDIALPSMNGLRACELIRGNPRLTDVPLVVCSARAHPEDEAQALLLGATFVPKPFLVRHYIAMVRRAVTACAGRAVAPLPVFVGAG